MKTFKVLSSFVSLVFLSASAFSQIVSVSQLDGYHENAGEMNFTPVMGAGYDSKVLVNDGFETFCVSREAYIGIPGSYYGSVNPSGIYQPDDLVISKGTAWLYSQFARGVLPGYHYGGAAVIDSGHILTERAEDAYTLQLAIWTLEGQYWYGAGPGTFSLNEDMGNPWLAKVATAFGGGTNGLLAAMGANNPGGYNVGVLNLNYINPDETFGPVAQPVLVLRTPPPPPPPFHPVVPGDTAPVSFWRLKKGVQLIDLMPNQPALGSWLATNFPNLYGAKSRRNVFRRSDNYVAALYISFYRLKDTTPDAQIMATALSCYVTSSNLARTTKATRYGFVVSPDGCGTRSVNVGLYGAAMGLENSTSYTVFDLLKQADEMKGAGTFDANAFRLVFEGINESGWHL